MKPFLINWEGFVIPSYTFMVMTASLAATWFGCRVGRKRGLNVVYLLDMAILSIIFGFLGARIAHVLIENPAYYWEKPIRFFYFWQGGFVSFGDYTAILAACYFYLKWRKAQIWTYMDVAALSFPIAVFLGRTGCLLAGCCFGKPTDSWFHLTFTDTASTAYQYYPGIPLHPTQIYLMLHQVVVWGVLAYVFKYRWRFQGQIVALLILLYAPGRFLIEFLRGDIDRGVYFGGYISSGQFAMTGFFVLGILGYWYFKRRALPAPSYGNR